jgi:hypothetical protein
MDVPGEHFAMPSLPRANQRDVATLAIRQGATCHSLQRREAEAGDATNRILVSRHVTLSARRETEAGVATTSSSTTRRAAVGVDDASHVYSNVQWQIR